MFKRFSFALLLAFLVAPSIATAQETYRGLLGETVEMSSLWGGTITSIDLRDTPIEPLSAMPEGTDIRYGTIPLGNGADHIISVAVRLGEIPLLWLDANNNEDLFDDGTPLADAQQSLFDLTWYREVSVSYWEDGVSSTEPYVLRIFATKLNSEWRFAYSSYCARKGLVQIESTLHTIWLLDADTDGLFNDISELTVVIDNDDDGEAALDFRSPEWFGLDFPYLSQGLVQIDDSLFGIGDVSSSGCSILIEQRDTDVTPLPSLRVGDPAPLGTATTIAGDSVYLNQHLGRPLLLLFAPLFQLYPEHLEDCPPMDDGRFSNCISELTCPTSGGASRAMERTRQLIKDVQQSSEKLGFEVFLVATDLQFLWLSTTNTFDQIDLPFPILWDETLALRYRNAIYDAMIIDQQGTIVARDSWTCCYDETGRLVRLDVDPLPATIIGDILGTLVEDEI